MISAPGRRIYGRDQHGLSDHVCQKETAFPLVGAAHSGGGAAVEGWMV